MILTGRQMGGARTNNSGGTLTIGDVVVQDTTGDEYVTTTTIVGDLDVCGVIIEGGADGEIVRVAAVDKVKINVDGATTRGQWLKTSSTAKKATPVNNYEDGCFARVVEAGGAGLIKAQLNFAATTRELPDDFVVRDYVDASVYDAIVCNENEVVCNDDTVVFI